MGALMWRHLTIGANLTAVLATGMRRILLLTVLDNMVGRSLGGKLIGSG